MQFLTIKPQRELGTMGRQGEKYPTERTRFKYESKKKIKRKF